MPNGWHGGHDGPLMKDNEDYSDAFHCNYKCTVCGDQTRLGKDKKTKTIWCPTCKRQTVYERND